MAWGRRQPRSAASLDAVFDLPREEVKRRVAAGTMKPSALAAHDYVNDVFE